MKKITLILMLLLATTVALAQENEIGVGWEPSAGADGYTLHYGVAPGQYGSALDVGAVTSTSVTLPTEGIQYCFAAKAYSGAGSSGFSNEDCSFPRPEIVTFNSNCTPRPQPEGGATCVATVAGWNFAPNVEIEIPVPGVTSGATTRQDSRSAMFNYEIAQTAPMGPGDVRIWNTSTGGNQVLKVYQGMVDVQPAVYPDPPESLGVF